MNEGVIRQSEQGEFLASRSSCAAVREFQVALASVEELQEMGRCTARAAAVGLERGPV